MAIKTIKPGPGKPPKKAVTYKATTRKAVASNTVNPATKPIPKYQPSNRKAYPSDATAIPNKSKSPMPDQPKYNYLNYFPQRNTKKITQKDSQEYERGFHEAIITTPEKPSRLGVKRVVGLSDRFNEGYSEGKDVAIMKKGSKGLSDYEKSKLNNWNAYHMREKRQYSGFLPEDIAKDKVAMSKKIGKSSSKKTKMAPKKGPSTFKTVKKNYK